ncbi:alanine racemase, partial [Candidatus Dependentiae bacterium]
DKFGVASIDEALILRSIGITKSIVLMEGVFDYAELAIAAGQDFELVLHNQEQANWLMQATTNCPSCIWIKIDTGMGRLGFTVQEGDAIYTKIAQSNCGIANLGIMSHFSMAENQSAPTTQAQKQVCMQLMERYQGPCSFVNSAGIFAFKKLHGNVVRPGIALYGISPFANMVGADLGLKPVMTLKSHLIAVKMLQKGHAVGYTASYICPETMPVGIVAIGYGDGYPRCATNGTPFLIKNVLCPLIGKVSMDMLAVDLRPLTVNASIGDEVLIWGNQLPVEKVAQHTNTIAYELLTRVQQRVVFKWI